LCTNSSSSDINIKLASLTTLGYICEELNTSDLNDGLKNNIIHALISNISENEGDAQPTKLAIKALIYSIPYTSQNF
jgi:hypothetical protein